MKKNLLLIVLLFIPFATASANRLVISKENLMDKIKGGWAGQTIGCSFGSTTEFRFQGRIIPDEQKIEWNEHHIRHFFDTWPDLYDDIYMDLTFVDVLHRLGPNAPVDSIAHAFAHAGYNLWHANQAARNNILDGLKAPETGHWRNNPHADDIDYQIEADYAGLIAPGMPNAANEYSDRIGHIMNYGDGWYGGVFVGTMYALAFMHNDIQTIVKEALRTIPPKSRFYKTIADIIEWHSQYPNDWKKTWQLCEDKWGKEVGCPEGVMQPLNIDASINSAYIVIGLLYGNEDFEKTMEISTRCGQDSDCNPASAAGILGCMMGYSNIPRKWMDNLYEVEDRPFKYTDISLEKAYRYSYELALKTIEREGGRIGEKAVEIRTQKPKKVKYEESFPGIVPAEICKGGTLENTLKIRFNGCGAVLRSYIANARTGYVATVNVYVDGKLDKTVNAPADMHSRKQEIYWNYDLEEGDHEIELQWQNPEEGIKIHCNSVVVYRKK